MKTPSTDTPAPEAQGAAHANQPATAEVGGIGVLQRSLGNRALGGAVGSLRLAGSPPTLLSLQRAAGNRAASQLVRSTPAGALPHAEQIQAAFGRHQLGGVQAHTGGAAEAAARSLQAAAFTSGDHVAFAGTPDLRTAAHEAAHVIQQRGGVRPSGGLDQPGDRWEQHADAVAEQVVRGGSAETLLDRFAGAAQAGGGDTIQRKFIYGGAPPPLGVHVWKDKTGRVFTLAGVADLASGVELTFAPADGLSLPETFIVPKKFGDQEFQSVAPDGLVYKDSIGTLTKITDLNLFTGYESAAVKSAFPDILEKDIQPEFHRTSFLARVSLMPTVAGVGTERYKTGELWVKDVKISNDRPSTKFGGEGQRSHTVAWSLLRAALPGLGEQRLDHFLAQLTHMLLALDAPTNTPEANKATATLIARIKEGLKITTDTNRLDSLSFWQLAASELLSEYVRAYQLSETATYADALAVGHGEPGNLAILRFSEAKLKLGGNLALNEAKAAVGAAIGMLDFKERLGRKNLGAIFQHWIDDLQLAFPALMKAHGNDIVVGLQAATSTTTEAKAALAGGLTVSPALQGKNTTVSLGIARAPASTALATASQSTFVANVALSPSASAARVNTDVASNNSGVITVAQLPLGHYRAPSLKIESVNVADDRPNTRFGALQRSHTVAWTLVRRHLINFSGKPVSALTTFISNELATLKGDIDSPEKNNKIGFDAPKAAIDARANLVANLNDPLGFPLFQWQVMLSDLIETYITLYQLSRSATYSKEERPKGHGEASAIATLKKADDDLSTGVDVDVYWAANKKDILGSAVKLVDAAVATSSLKPGNWQIAIAHWLHLVKDYFPRVTAIKNFDQQIQEEVAVLEPSDELLAGYPDNLSQRDKVLVNLLENAKKEVRSVPESFAGDLYSSIRLELASFAAPDADLWEDLTNSLKLGVKFTRDWSSKLQAYLVNPRRNVVRPVPDDKAIKKVIDDVGEYFTFVKSKKDDIVKFLAGSLLEKAVKQDSTSATVLFIKGKDAEIKKAIGDGIDNAVALSALGTIENYNDWFKLIQSVDKKSDVNYTTLVKAITG